MEFLIMSVFRIYVEKKKGFDVEAAQLFADVKENLHLDGLQGIRILNRYDIDGIDDATYEAAKLTVFAEPAIDTVYEETMPEMTGSAIFFAVEYLPGQYDQRADSAAQCIKLMNSAADATVRFARVIVWRWRPQFPKTLPLSQALQDTRRKNLKNTEKTWASL